MKYITYIAYILIILVGLTSCEEEIKWKEEKLPEMLVVEGSFTNEYKKHQIILSSSDRYFSNVQTPKVSGASIAILDDSETYLFNENPIGSGIYETVDSVAGIPGKSYTLDINLQEPINNCTHYYATGELNQGIKIDSLIVMLYENPIYFDGGDIDSLMTIIVAIGLDPPEIKNYYQLNIYLYDSLLNDTIDEVSLINDSEGMNGEYAHTFMFFYQFQENDSIQLELQSVEESYTDFVRGVQNIANQSADPFDMSGPPANAIGNIH